MAGVVKQLAGGGSGQSFMDRVTAAKHSISGAGLAKAVCKATTEEILAPKKKHLHYLIECTNESNVSIPELANELTERLKHQNWVVVFKSLISMHSLMNYGNERFTQYLASNNCSFALVNFVDKSTVQGADMSRFICRYSAYVQEKAIAYRVLGFDFCKVKRGSEDAVLRTMPGDKILRALSVLLAQFDCLLNFDATGGELSNGVINAAFTLLYKDASRLFVVFNDGIINLLSKFFEAMNKKQCREALEIYKKFVNRSERLAEFSKVAEYVGIERADLTRLEKHPASFLDAMESHLAHLEGRGGGKFPRSGSNNSLGAGGATASAAPAAAAAPAETPKLSQLLLEEQQQLDRLKAEQLQRKAAAAAAAKPPPQTAAPVAFATPAPAPAPVAAAAPASQFQNDFGLLLGGAGAAAPAHQNYQQQQHQHHHQQQQHQHHHQQQQQQAAFIANFPASNAPPAGFDPFGAVLQPVSANNNQQSAPSGLNNSAAAGPTGRQQSQPQAAGSGLTGDLDSSLASLVGSLSMKQGGLQAKPQGINWGGSSGGGSGGATSAATARPSASAGTGPVGVKISAGPTVNWGGQAPVQQPAQQYLGQPYPVPPGYNGQGQPLAFLHTQSQPAFRVPPQQQQPQFQQAGWQANSNDPFGAL